MYNVSSLNMDKSMVCCNFLAQLYCLAPCLYDELDINMTSICPSGLIACEDENVCTDSVASDGSCH